MAGENGWIEEKNDSSEVTQANRWRFLELHHRTFFLTRLCNLGRLCNAQNSEFGLFFNVPGNERLYGGRDTPSLYPGMQWENSYKPSNSVLDSEWLQHSTGALSLKTFGVVNAQKASVAGFSGLRKLGILARFCSSVPQVEERPQRL